MNDPENQEISEKRFWNQDANCHENRHSFHPTAWLAASPSMTFEMSGEIDQDKGKCVVCVAAIPTSS